ncbi:MAG: response regulator [Burkholderiaceae bacterium]
MKNHKHTILIVDDVPMNIHILAETLCNDYHIKIAASGKDALLVFESFHIDLVLLDVQMPVMDGFEVCRRMKAVAGKESVPVIFVTTNNTAEDRAVGIEAGAVDYLAKPFNYSMLRDRVKKHLSILN